MASKQRDNLIVVQYGDLLGVLEVGARGKMTGLRYKACPHTLGIRINTMVYFYDASDIIAPMGERVLLLEDNNDE